MIKTAIIEDNSNYRMALSSLLEMNSGMSLIHSLVSCDEMIGRFQFNPPDVVLMDIDLPGISGIQGVWELKKIWPDMKVLMLTVFEDEEKIFGAIRAGANGYLLKKDTPQKILDSIQMVHQGESPMNGMIASKVLEYFMQEQKTSSMLFESNLTTRENEILQHLIKGHSYKEIAGVIFISVETLNTHIKNIYRKLNVHSRAELSAKYSNTR